MDNPTEPVTSGAVTPPAESAPAQASPPVSTDQPEAVPPAEAPEASQVEQSQSTETVSTEMYNNLQTALRQEREKRREAEAGRFSADSQGETYGQAFSSPENEGAAYLQSLIQQANQPLVQEVQTLRQELNTAKSEAKRMSDWNDFVKQHPDIKEYGKEIEEVVVDIAKTNPDFAMDSGNLKIIYDAARGRAKARGEKMAAQQAIEETYQTVAAKEESSNTTRGGKSTPPTDSRADDLKAFASGDEDAQANIILKRVLKKK